MPFKPTILARQSILKSFKAGYAQSLVAASQSSSASHNTQFSTLSNNVVSYFGKPGVTPTSASQNAAQLPNGLAGPGSKAGQPDASGNESGLAAYYAAWHKHQNQRSEDKEWHQFQFAKRIGWKAPTTIPEPQQAKEQSGLEASEAKEVPTRGILPRTKSASAIDELKNEELDLTSLTSTNIGNDNSVDIQKQDDSLLATPQNTSSPPAASSHGVSSPSADILSVDNSTKATSVSDVEAYTDQITALAENQKYGDVPVVFESMLKSGITPSASAYNALLLAAINLPRGKHHIVPKVLDVYSDMLRRRVAPDTSTYAVLIEVLAARALDVTAMKKDLLQRQARYGGMDQAGSFMFRSDETEYKIVAEDDSLSVAIKLFDTAAALSTDHIFSSETYRLLVSACAEHGRIGDMVRVYAQMESQQVSSPTGIFAPMIKAFAVNGDLRSSVECYDEYKALAVAHDQGEISIVRKDEEVYAALVRAYALCGRLDGGLKFLGKIEDGMAGSENLPAIRNAVAVQSLIPEWLERGDRQKALQHASGSLTKQDRLTAMATICVDAADKNDRPVATEAFSMLGLNSSDETITAAMALLAMHVRGGDVEAARSIWQTFTATGPSALLIEPSTMYALSLVGSGDAKTGLSEARQMFARIRETQPTAWKAEVAERIDESIEVIGKYVLDNSPVPSSATSLEVLRIMVENGGAVSSLAERLLAVFGPSEISHLPWNDLNILIQIQAGILLGHTNTDIANFARFTHLVEVITASGLPTDPTTSKIIEQALSKVNKPELTARWQNQQMQPPTMLYSPVQMSAVYSPPMSLSQSAYEDTYDPYGASTDFRGSAIITEELEKTTGRHSSHLNEALLKFKNMRRAGRHPRYVTYGKLITAAAKENKFNLAQDILAMARQDVPMLPHSRVVTHGWTTIFDAMVGACLTLGNRNAAAQFHQELTNMGAAPSANTFGLYITTLKESGKTFDEASEAVKIFQRAKSEQVEPSSFLYNALIGKLGKARRIDDCLFYFAEMRNLGIRPTSVTYGTIVNALCRVSDDKFAEELFEEMETMPNYKPRPAPYNCMMQYFLTTKRDRSKVLTYYNRMRKSNITPTMHTYKLLVDTHATLDPVDMNAAEAVLEDIKSAGYRPEAVHYASLIHAKGCVLQDLPAARATFDQVIASNLVPPNASLYQAIFESIVSNHAISSSDTSSLLQQMENQRVKMTPYIANTLIHGWALEKDIDKARKVYEGLGMEGREPSTYEAMIRAFLAVGEQGLARGVAGEALRRGYPSAVVGKIVDLVGGGSSEVVSG